MTTFGLRKDLKPLTNLDLLALVKKLEIKNFRGIFMRGTLLTQGSARHSPSEGLEEKEAGIVNLDSSEGKGTHWVCYSQRSIHCWDICDFVARRRAWFSEEILVAGLTIQRPKFDPRRRQKFLLLDFYIKMLLIMWREQSFLRVEPKLFECVSSNRWRKTWKNDDSTRKRSSFPFRLKFDQNLTILPFRPNLVILQLPAVEITSKATQKGMQTSLNLV